MTGKIRSDSPVKVLTESPQSVKQGRYSLVFCVVGTLCVITALCQGVLFNPTCQAWNEVMDQEEIDLKNCNFRVRQHESAFHARAIRNCKNEIQRTGVVCLSQDILEFCHRFSKDRIPFEWRTDTNQCTEQNQVYFQQRPVMPLSCLAKRVLDNQDKCQKIEKRWMQRWWEAPPLCVLRRV